MSSSFNWRISGEFNTCGWMCVIRIHVPFPPLPFLSPQTSTCSFLDHYTLALLPQALRGRWALGLTPEAVQSLSASAASGFLSSVRCQASLALQFADWGCGSFQLLWSCELTRWIHVSEFMHGWLRFPLQTLDGIEYQPDLLAKVGYLFSFKWKHASDLLSATLSRIIDS